MRMPKKRDVYRHFKGNCYLVIGLAKNCTNDGDRGDYVVYKRLGSNKTYIPPLSSRCCCLSL